MKPVMDSATYLNPDDVLAKTAENPYDMKGDAARYLEYLRNNHPRDIENMRIGTA